MFRKSHFWLITAIILFVLIAIPHGRFLIIPPHIFAIPPHIRELAIFGVICLLVISVISAIRAHGYNSQRSNSSPGTFGPGAPPPRPDKPAYGPRPGNAPNNGQYGFIGPTHISTVAQAQSLEHRTPVIIKGCIVMALGGDLYTFTDLSTEITLRIGPKEWEDFGSTITPSDTIEISGELHRDPGDYQRAPEIHARLIRKL
ncbi:MAG: NirD/YgiW/YdeI family stress tolerance protein [Treponema sp.]|nr:NirD/YgiW/YdeI family stress tolerance protein [Treponema sp.]